MRKHVQLAVLGGGPAGMSAALAAHRAGLSEILIIERDRELGGILNQCVHHGFGLHYFKREMTGPEYAQRLIDDVSASPIEVALDTMALAIEPEGTGARITVMSEACGLSVIEADALILAMGCRERTRGAIQIPGTRAAGILTAGTAQRYVNIEGYMVGRRVIILGSGDIGLIMARRMTLEGAEVVACVELLPYSGGLARNIAQCLDDFDIPLLLAHTITNIEGKRRVERVTVQKVDPERRPIPGTEIYYDVDTVLLSVGLIPENELTRSVGIEIDPKTSGAAVDQHNETSMAGVFACGNVLHVHDLVDDVTVESEYAGRAAARHVLHRIDRNRSKRVVTFTPDPSIAYTVPQRIDLDDLDETTRVYFRVRAPHKRPMHIEVADGDDVIATFRRPYMAPGEMEHIALPRERLAAVTTDRLTVRVVEVREERHD